MTSFRRPGDSFVWEALPYSTDLSVDDLKVNDIVVLGPAIVGGLLQVTGTVTAATPTLPAHLTTKQYVDDAIAAAIAAI